MYKAILKLNNGKRQTIAPFPSENWDLYALLHLLDKCEIKAFEITLYNGD